MSTFFLPDLGEGLPDAEIHEWHVKEGDEVQIDAPLVSMETAKAVVDVPSPFKGKIKKLHGTVGDKILTGKPLVEFEGVEKKDTGTVAGQLQEGQGIVQEPTFQISKQASGIKATPAVRALAQQLGVDMTMVKPTGPNNTITADDVRQSKNALNELGDFEPLSGVRRAMAASMMVSHEQVVPVTVFDDADVSSWIKEGDISARLIRALIVACQTEPALNAWFDHKAFGRRISKKIDIGIAMDAPEGLFVPVLRDAASKNLNQIRTEINRFKELVTTRKIAAEELRNPTITLSNFGKFAGKYASPIIVPPQVAIIASGRLIEGVGVVNGEIKIRHYLPISLTFDHRAITGGEATRFLGALLSDLQKSV